MNTSSRFVVATHILVVLTGHRWADGDDYAVKSDFLSESVNTNPVVIRRILGMLRKAGLVISQTGPDGGTRLARKPESITLLRIYKAVEEGSLFHLHYNTPDLTCPVGAHIQDCLAGPLQEAEAALKKSLAGKTLAQVAKEIADRSGLTKLIAMGLTMDQITRHYVTRSGKFVKKS
ncbi:Rrf2 family transcriptional regulator [candidate division KSB1 bacterium]|nr:Rrf2 family transcriptional regulator [candidate division KSB1 bacterium]